MNKQRRLKLAQIIEKMYELEAEIEELADEEQEAYDNIQDTNLACSQKAEEMEEALDILVEGYEAITEACQNLEELTY